MESKKITNIEVKKKNRNEVFRYICKKRDGIKPGYLLCAEAKPSDSHADYQRAD